MRIDKYGFKIFQCGVCTTEEAKRACTEVVLDEANERPMLGIYTEKNGERSTCCYMDRNEVVSLRNALNAWLGEEDV